MLLASPSHSRIAFDQVDPISFANEAAGILKAAWQPPCLDYSAEWLRWRLSGPSPLPPLGFVAVSESKPVAFAAAFGVRVGSPQGMRDVYLCSFMCACPGASASVAPLLLRTEGKYFKQTAIPTLVFAQVASAGEQLLAVLDALKISRHSLGTYVGHAGLYPSASVAPAEITRPETWIAARNAIEPGQPLVEASFDCERLEYELTDPWGRQCAVAYGPDGEPAATALIGNTRTLGKNGPQTLASLHYVRAKTAPGLSALLALALRNEPRGVATIPNCAAISAEILRTARIRSTPSQFACYSFSVNPQESPLTLAAATDMEII